MNRAEGVICRLQVAGYMSQVAIIIIIIIVIIVIIVIIITINYCRNHGKLREYIHTYALMNERTRYECPSPEDSLR